MNVTRVRAFSLLFVGMIGGCGRSDAPSSSTSPVLLHELPAVAAGQDVTVHLSKFRTGNDALLRKFIDRIGTTVSRPWTVERLGAAYAAAIDDPQRAALVYLLAASRDPLALRIVGNALAHPEVETRVVAAEGIVDYWVPVKSEGGAEMMIDVARSFWEEHVKTIRSGRDAPR